MANYDITTGVQTVTSSGAVTGSLSTASLSGDWTVKVDVLGLTAGATARIVVEDTANSSAFSDASSVAVFDVAGAVGSAEGTTGNGPNESYSKKSYECPTCSVAGGRFGVTNSKLRVNVQELTGSSPSLTLHAYLVN